MGHRGAHEAQTRHVTEAKVWARRGPYGLWELRDGEENQGCGEGAQKAHHICRQRLQCPDSSSHPFCVTWAVSSQGLKSLAVYLKKYGRERSRHRGRSREKGWGE